MVHLSLENVKSPERVLLDLPEFARKFPDNIIFDVGSQAGANRLSFRQRNEQVNGRPFQELLS